MVAEVRPNYPTEWAAMKAVAAKLGIGAAETVRMRVRKTEVDAGQRPGTTSEEATEIKRLRAENAELRRANEILKAGRLSSRQCQDVGDRRACTGRTRLWWLVLDVSPAGRSPFGAVWLDRSVPLARSRRPPAA